MAPALGFFVRHGGAGAQWTERLELKQSKVYSLGDGEELPQRECGIVRADPIQDCTLCTLDSRL